jgi:phosphatidylinositol alpha-1,6-mannosyltransferase
MRTSANQPPLLIISRNLPPVIGGIERLMHRLLHELDASTECWVIGPRGCREHLPSGMRVFEIPHRPAPLFMLLAMLTTAGCLLARRFRAVLAGNGLMALVALPARLRRVPIVTMVYGLDVVTENPLYRAVCLPAIRSSDAVIACSTNTARLARERGVTASRLSIALPGVEMPKLPPSPEDAARIDDGRPLLVSVGRLVRRKGIADFIRHALPAIVERVPTVRYVVIGAAPVAALKREPAETGRIRAAICAASMERHVELAGFVDDGMLEAWMSIARAHVFPVLDLPQDVEGFGLVALEAAARGVPTVAFDAGGVSDAVAPGRSGALVPSGDYAALATAVVRVLEEPARAQAHSCQAFARDHDWPSYARNVLRVLQRVAPSNPGGSPPDSSKSGSPR